MTNILNNLCFSFLFYNQRVTIHQDHQLFHGQTPAIIKLKTLNSYF